MVTSPQQQPNPPTNPTPVFCDECGTRIGVAQGDKIVVFGSHHGQKHQTVIHSPVARGG